MPACPGLTFGRGYSACITAEPTHYFANPRPAIAARVPATDGR